MAEVVRKEPPVLIENVSLVINVFNIGNHGDLNVNELPLAGHHCGQQPRGLFQHNGLIQASTTTTAISPNSRSTEASGSLQKSLNGPELNVKEQFPLGWIACLNGDVIPFGVQPTALEIPSFGERKAWKEIRVCLPPSLFVDNETDLYCPVSSCREKLPRNKSVDSHIKKHLGFTDKASSQMSGNSSNTDGSLPCPLVYYCQDKKCQYYVESAEKSFKAYKNVKQHYQKVHAPRLFECNQCQKTFSTQKVLATHKLMCGEMYSCSTCNLSYDTLESLQTHCRRKAHAYDHNKYKDKRNSVKQELQSQKICTSPAAAATAPTSFTATTSTGRKPKTRKLPTILPKGTLPASAEVFNTIQAFCQRAGVKVDLGCQTVCTGFIHKSNPVEAVTPPDAPSFAQKKRKSTDTQTNIVKFRATCVDQKHNATNTNFDWKKVITSDSQTQTADSCDTVELSASKPATDSSVHFNDEFATFKISESSTSSDVKSVLSGAPTLIPVSIDGYSTVNTVKQEEDTSTFTSPNLEESTSFSSKPTTTASISSSSTTSSIKVENGPSLHPEFISFLEAIDSATQTDPEMFDVLGNGECFGIRALFGDDLADAYYVSVSSTASQTAVESVATKSLSAEDYEALLNTTDDKRIMDLDAFSEYIKSVEGTNVVNQQSESNVEGGGSGPQQGTSDFLYDWEHIVEEVYRDVGD